MRGPSEVPVKCHTKEGDFINEFNFVAEELEFKVRIVNFSTFTEKDCLGFGG